MINKAIQSLTSPDDKSRGNVPTKEDIKETISLLGGFGIHIVLPKFTSKRQMYLWRKSEIMKRLGA